GRRLVCKENRLPAGRSVSAAQRPDHAQDGSERPRDHESNGHGSSPSDRRVSLGPGLVAGASDTDPTTVATLSVIGSSTAFALSWLLILNIALMVVVQLISAQV